jgi:hypothetical protein
MFICVTIQLINTDLLIWCHGFNNRLRAKMGYFFALFLFD